jgi:hypothetical protein
MYSVQRVTDFRKRAPHTRTRRTRRLSRLVLGPKELFIYDRLVHLTPDFFPFESLRIRDDDSNDADECSSTDMLAVALRYEGASRASARSVIELFFFHRERERRGETARGHHR